MEIYKIVTALGTVFEVGKPGHADYQDSPVIEIHQIKEGEEAGKYKVLIGNNAAVIVSKAEEVYRR